MRLPPIGRLATLSSGTFAVAHAGGNFVGRLVLIERLAVDAVGIALHDERAVVHDGKDVRRDAHVVAHQIALGDFQLRPEHFAQIADLQRLPIGKPQRPRIRPALDLVELIENGLQIGRTRVSHAAPQSRRDCFRLLRTPRRTLAHSRVDSSSSRFTVSGFTSSLMPR